MKYFSLIILKTVTDKSSVAFHPDKSLALLMQVRQILQCCYMISILGNILLALVPTVYSIKNRFYLALAGLTDSK